MARIHYANDRLVIAAKTCVSVLRVIQDDEDHVKLRLERSLNLQTLDGYCSPPVGNLEVLDTGPTSAELSDPARSPQLELNRSGDGEDSDSGIHEDESFGPIEDNVDAELTVPTLGEGIGPSGGSPHSGRADQEVINQSGSPVVGDTSDGKKTAKQTGKTPNSAPQIDEQILGSAFSRDGTFFAVVLSTKRCAVFDTRRDWALHRSIFAIPKAPTSVSFDADGRYLIVADRSGAIRRYANDDSRMGNHRDAIGEYCECEGEPLSGHVSIVLDACVSACARYLLSADRDEKLRISRYPQSFLIHRFCLGHTAYISSLAVLPPHFAFTSGGDGKIFVWNIETGAAVAVCDDFEGRPIRCLRLAPPRHSQSTVKIAVVMDAIGMVRVVSFSLEDNSFAVLVEKLADESVVDVTFLGDHHLIAITRSSVMATRLDISGSFVEIRGVDASVLKSVEESRDGLADLRRKTGFDNVGDYLEKKKEREKKKKRKVDETPVA